MKSPFRLFKPGDWLTLAAAASATLATVPLLASLGPAEKAVVRLDGVIVAELPLTTPRNVNVQGPLGLSVIEIAVGRARVAADPGPRQYCVKQGWLTRANSVAICAPNHVSLTLAGPGSSHDTLNY